MGIVFFIYQFNQIQNCQNNHFHFLPHLRIHYLTKILTSSLGPGLPNHSRLDTWASPMQASIDTVCPRPLKWISLKYTWNQNIFMLLIPDRSMNFFKSDSERVLLVVHSFLIISDIFLCSFIEFLSYFSMSFCHWPKIIFKLSIYLLYFSLMNEMTSKFIV